MRGFGDLCNEPGRLFPTLHDCWQKQTGIIPPHSRQEKKYADLPNWFNRIKKAWQGNRERVLPVSESLLDANSYTDAVLVFFASSFIIVDECADITDRVYMHSNNWLSQTEIELSASCEHLCSTMCGPTTIRLTPLDNSIRSG